MKRVAALLCLAFAACGADPAEQPVVGTLERERVELIAELSEPIVLVSVREGDRVAQGQVVLRLDDTLAAADLARAQALRDQLGARVAELERGPRQEQIREARARVAGANSAVRNAERELDRARELEAQSFESRARRDSLQAQRDEARARREQAAAALEAMERGTTEEELAQARDARAGADAALVRARLQLERMTVRAPRAGVVDALPFERGERPPPGAVVAVLLAADAPYARVYVPEALRVRIQSGGRARVRIAGREGELDGVVRALGSEAAFTPYFALTQHDRGRLSYLAEVEIASAHADALPTGVPVEVRFELEASAAAEPSRVEP